MQDHKDNGSGDLLAQSPMHANNWDGVFDNDTATVSRGKTLVIDLIHFSVAGGLLI
jgi:hypothetical protein